MLPEFKIAQLRHFVWVTELKGFHSAAEKACRTQPAISLSIKDLENIIEKKGIDAGVNGVGKLVNYSARKIRLLQSSKQLADAIC